MGDGNLIENKFTDDEYFCGGEMGYFNAGNGNIIRSAMYEVFSSSYKYTG